MSRGPPLHIHISFLSARHTPRTNCIYSDVNFQRFLPWINEHSKAVKIVANVLHKLFAFSLSANRPTSSSRHWLQRSAPDSSDSRKLSALLKTLTSRASVHDHVTCICEVFFVDFFVTNCSSSAPAVSAIFSFFAPMSFDFRTRFAGRRHTYWCTVEARHILICAIVARRYSFRPGWTLQSCPAPLQCFTGATRQRLHAPIS